MLMRIRKIDKEILETIFPNEKMKFLQATPDKKLRGYTNSNNIALFICDKSISRVVVDSFTQIMLKNKNFDVVISHHKDKILVTMTKIDKSPKPQANAIEEEYYDEEDYCQQDDMPYAYTNGYWTPCPYCGSDRISTFMDGTAKCDDCKREFTYMQF